jgi:hypothetical protein
MINENCEMRNAKCEMTIEFLSTTDYWILCFSSLTPEPSILTPETLKLEMTNDGRFLCGGTSLK